MPDSEFQEIKKALENHEERIKHLENLLEKEEVMPEIEMDVETLARKTKVSSGKIKELFDVEDNTLTLLKFKGESEEEKTQNISLIVLLGYKYFFGNENIPAGELKRNVAENGIPVNNFATHLNRIIPSLIRRKGKIRSPKTAYKLTMLGERKARELLKQWCVGR